MYRMPKVHRAAIVVIECVAVYESAPKIPVSRGLFFADFFKKISSVFDTMYTF